MGLLMVCAVSVHFMLWYIIYFYSLSHLQSTTTLPLTFMPTWTCPFFFLLSGLSLTLAHGKTLWSGSTRCCLGCKTTSSDRVTDSENHAKERSILDSWAFYKKRLTRILPLHYLGHIAVIIAHTLGYIDSVLRRHR